MCMINYWRGDAFWEKAGKKGFGFNFKVKVVGSPPTLALRSKPCVATQTGPKGFKRNPLESCVFLLLEYRGCAGWDGRVSAATLFVAKCRRLGGSLAAGFQPAKKDSRFSTSCSASLLNATYWHLHRAVSVGFGLVWFGLVWGFLRGAAIGAP